MAGLVDLIVLLVALIIIWVIVSLPVYIAAKVVTKGKAEFGAGYVGDAGRSDSLCDRLRRGLLLPRGCDRALCRRLSPSCSRSSLGSAFYRSVFEVGWLGAIGIAILAVIVVFILSVILVALFGVSMPSFFHPF